jgi:Ala-tRNA(Pro) deacylase
MPATPEDLFRRLDELGIETVTHHHPPLFTVEDSKQLRGTLPGGHHKNLFLRDKKKQTYLVVLPEDQDVDLKSLPERIGSGRLSFGSADRLMEFLGVLPGAVTPFALINDTACAVRVVLDAGMLERSPLNYHPLVNTMTTAIEPDDLLRFIAACGHEPLITTL